ncbi:nicotinamide riboside transporter PnuC [Shewanella saliphila]|uniref:Nicotinamide riboside transporter PnuC n=1 Tax=Shewanella saliphila TaxID=2282698 RepID=A0ABQ2Q6T6_9GAMM|nr:nicotinamide riboside transporter PnuC [Shewanella saliphila]MCL1102338.1 nicotinamide riboside transporter PnuC [Shewanella saliphila]GGP56011.1 nicotinamide mononucleotide transporter [Shewanella saliphila]
MNDVMLAIQQAFNEASVMTFWEAIAVMLALAYLILAMRTNIWCWSAAFLSTAIYTVLFWNVSLLMESVLNIYYMGMAVYGYWLWLHVPSVQQSQQHNVSSQLNITSWTLKTHTIVIAVTSLVSIVVGYGMANYTAAAFPYIDAATTCFAVMTTYLVAKKVLENWLYWVVIDVVSIYLYFQKGLMLTSGLFILYVAMAVAGYMMWRKKYQHTVVEQDKLSQQAISV